VTSAASTELEALALARLGKGDIPGAVNAYKRLTRVKPENPCAWYQLGKLQVEIGLVEQGLDSICQSLKLDDQCPAVWFSRATMEQALGKSKSAIRSGLKVLAIEPDTVEAWMLLGALAEQLKHYEEQENCSWHALRLEPDNQEALVSYAHALYQQGRLAEAEDACREAIDGQASNASALACMAMTLIARSRVDDANEYLDLLLRKYPGYAQHLNAMGQECLSKNDAHAAIGLFASLIKLNEQIEWAYTGLSQAYLMAGRKIDAEENLERALQLFPDLPGAKSLMQKIKLALNFKLTIQS